MSGGTISDAGSGLINVSALHGFIKQSDSNVGITVFFDLAAQSNIGNIAPCLFTDNSVNYIYVDYNSGSPVISSTIDRKYNS